MIKFTNSIHNVSIAFMFSKRILFPFFAVTGGLSVAFVSVYFVFWFSGDKNPSVDLQTDHFLYRESDIPGIPYELVPNSVGKVIGVDVRINKLGFRGPDIEPEKPPGTFRVAVLGDSMVFGRGVDEANTLPQQLSARLKESYPDIAIEVLNAGFDRFNTVQEAVLLRHRVLPLNPDLLVLGITELNDLETTPFKFVSPLPKKYEESFWRKVPVVGKILAWKVVLEYSRLHEEHVHNLYKEDSKTWLDFVAALSEIKVLCDERNIPVSVIIFPWLQDLAMFEAERMRIIDELKNLDAPFVNPVSALTGRHWRTLVISNRDHHPNAACHSIFAELLTKRIKSSDIIFIR